MKTALQPAMVFARFGDAFAYPNAQLLGTLRDLRDAVGETGDGCAQKVAQLIQYVVDTPVRRLEEQYTRAFDLSPVAVPYLSVYIFGAESPQRGQFMAGLMGAYTRAGYACSGELPDHLAVLLSYAPKAPPDEWEELRTHCLGSPLRMMQKALEDAKNPYALLVAALRDFVNAVGEKHDV